MKISCWEGLQLIRQRWASDLHDYIFSLLEFTDGIPVDVNYETPVSELYLSLVKNFIERDKSLDVLSMCRNFNSDRKTLSDESAGLTQATTASLLTLLVLNEISRKNSENNNEENNRKNDEKYERSDEGNDEENDQNNNGEINKAGKKNNTERKKCPRKEI